MRTHIAFISTTHGLLWVTAVLGSVAFMAVDRDGPETAVGPSIVEHKAAPARSNDRTAPRTATATATATSIPSDPASSGIDEQIAEKYDPLLVRLDPQSRKRLQHLLASAESNEDLIKAAERERLISLLLRDDEYALYERLRESTRSHARLEALAQRVVRTRPLTQQQRRDLLVAMLAHENELQLWELQSNLDRSDIPAMEAEYARDIAARGLDHHRQAFLESARSILDAQQWSALIDLEHTPASPSRGNAD